MDQKFDCSIDSWRVEFISSIDYSTLANRVIEMIPEHLVVSKDNPEPPLLRPFHRIREEVKVFLMDADFDGRRWDTVLYPLSVAQGILNELSIDDVKELLKLYKLNLRGKELVLRKRLKHFISSIYNRQHSSSIPKSYTSMKKYDFYLFLNVQCNIAETSNIDKYINNIDELLEWEPRRKIWDISCKLRREDFLDDYNYEDQEIIRFDALMVKAYSFQFVSSFGCYVNIAGKRKLSTLTKVLTKISQAQVNNAPKFETVYRSFFSWLLKNGALKSVANVLIMTDGSHDIDDYLRNSFYRSRLSFPYYLRSYVDIKRLFQRFYKLRTKGVVRMNLQKSLYLLDLPYFRCECCPTGVNSVLNLARIAKAMADDNCCLSESRIVHDKVIDRPIVELKQSTLDRICKSVDPILLNGFIDLPPTNDPLQECKKEGGVHMPDANFYKFT